MNVDAMSDDTSRLWPSRAVKGAALGILPGAVCGAITGACWGFLMGLTPVFAYAGWFVGWIVCVPLYTTLGALLGMFVGAIVGAAGAAVRSAVVGAIVGGGLALVIGLLLVIGTWIAAGEPEVVQIRQNYPQWEVQRVEAELNVNNDQWLLVFGIVLPAVLCILLATLGTALTLLVSHHLGKH